MSTEINDPGDARLRKVLQAWQVSASLPPGFQEGVWRQIARQEPQPAPFWEWLRRRVLARWRPLLTQPAGAAAYLLALLILGSGLGYWRSESYTAKAESAWRTAYVQSVDPSALDLDR